jgi:hypothetical protein
MYGGDPMLVYREAHDLVIDYGEALREGSLPTFLKSLSRFEGREVLRTPNFWHGAEMMRIVNGIAFGDEMTYPNLDIFLARVHARIASRARKANVARRIRPRSGVPDQNQQE